MNQISNETKQLIKDMKVETITDFGTFKELETIAAELLNSNDTSNKLLALRLKQRLNENPNYQQFTQQAKIEAEQATEQTEKELQKKQEIKHNNAVNNNLESKKKAEEQAKAAEQKTINEFNKLSLEQQKMLIELENEFKPENKAALREFILNEEKSTPQNFANIMNKEIGSDVVKIEKAEDGTEFITMDKSTTLNEAKEVAEKSEKTADAAIEAGKMKPAVVAASTMDAANVKTAEKNVENNEEVNKNISRSFHTTEDKIKSNSFINEMMEKVLPKHEEKLKKLEGMSDDEKQEEVNKYNKGLQRSITKSLETFNVDLNNSEQRKDIADSLAFQAANGGNSANIEKLVKALNIEKEFNEAKKEEKEAVAAIDLDEIDSNPQPKAQTQEVEVFNPSVQGQNEREGIAYDIAKEVTKTYNSGASQTPQIVIANSDAINSSSK